MTTNRNLLPSVLHVDLNPTYFAYVFTSSTIADSSDFLNNLPFSQIEGQVIVFLYMSTDHVTELFLWNSIKFEYLHCFWRFGILVFLNLSLPPYSS